MKKSGCRGHQSKKKKNLKLKNLLLTNPYLDSIIILQECSLSRGSRIPLKQVIRQKTWLLWEIHLLLLCIEQNEFTKFLD